MSAPDVTTIEISKDYLHFNAAHFTLFSATEREDLHGHTFYLAVVVDSPVGDDGLAFDYNLFKRMLQTLCAELDEKVLLPERSPHLTLERCGDYVVAAFADERIPFLPRDVHTLPVRNITVEELAAWFLERLQAGIRLESLPLTRLVVRVSSGPGQSASVTWQGEPS